MGRRIGGLTTVIGFALLFGAIFEVPILAGGPGPVIVPGNPTCAVGDFSFKDEDGPLSPATNEEVAITYADETHTSVVALAEFTIDAVIIKAGPNAAIYTSPPWTDLESITNPGGNVAAISHVTVCYSAASTTSSTSTDSTRSHATTSSSRASTTTTPTSSSSSSSSAASTSSSTSPSSTTTSSTTTATTSPSSTTTATTSPSSTTTSPTSPSSTTTATTSPSSTTTSPTAATTSPTSGTTPAVSVLPSQIDQPVLPQTGLDDIPTAVWGAALIVVGSGILIGVEQRERRRRRVFSRLP